jgi:very-short-patch-repair endonuclease
VDTPSDSPLALKQADLFKQRFNVAASRARNQMWVVYSLDPKTDLKDGDLRRRLIEHALDPKSIERQMEKAEKNVESEFERLVARRLIEKQYHVIPQWKVGSHRIDLVIQDGEDSKKRLAIECDGDRFHPIEKLGEDLERQAVLERLGWRFLRLRGSEFFRKPDATMKRVFEKLDAMEIRPAGSRETGSESADATSSDTIDEVIRRAAELRAQWQEDEPIESGRLF